MIELRSRGDWDFEIWTEGSPVGWAAIQWDGAVPRLDCWLNEANRGHGYALATCNELLEHLENENTCLVCAECELENAAAMRLLNRLGFELKRVQEDVLYFEGLL